MQSSSSSRVFNPTLAGASPATDAIVRVAQLDQSATVRRWRSQVRFLPWTPFESEGRRKKEECRISAEAAASSFFILPSAFPQTVIMM
jgi:hypothetical protein